MLQTFKDIWKKYDHNGDGFLDVNKFENLILDFVDKELELKEELMKEDRNKKEEKDRLFN